MAQADARTSRCRARKWTFSLTFQYVTVPSLLHVEHCCHCRHCRRRCRCCDDGCRPRGCHRCGHPCNCCRQRVVTSMLAAAVVAAAVVVVAAAHRVALPTSLRVSRAVSTLGVSHTVSTSDRSRVCLLVPLCRHTEGLRQGAPPPQCGSLRLTPAPGVSRRWETFRTWRGPCAKRRNDANAQPVLYVPSNEQRRNNDK